MNNESPEPSEVTWEYYTGPGSVPRRRLKQDGRPKPHVCEVCDRAFDRPSALLQHNHTHTGERPHLCPVCKQKRFATTSNLYRHSRSCRGARSDFIAVSYGERLLGVPEYGPTGDLTPDPMSDSVGNGAARHRVFPTSAHSENCPPYPGDESILPSRDCVTHHQPSSTTMTARTPKSEVLEDSSLQPTTPPSAFVVADVDDARNETLSSCRAPPLFSARPPKAYSESKQDIRPADVCTLSSSSDAPLVNPPKPTVSSDPRQSVQSLSNTFALPHKLPYYQFTPPTSTSPEFSTFDASRLGTPRMLAGVSLDGPTSFPTNLKWADEAKKTRRTTPSQKR